MSLYEQYLTERTDDKIIETSVGFATYRFLNAEQVYIVDIFVLPEFRKTGVASSLADQIAKEAKNMGCKEMLGTVNPSAKGSTESLKVLFAYGMKLFKSTDNVIVCKKEI